MNQFSMFHANLKKFFYAFLFSFYLFNIEGPNLVYSRRSDHAKVGRLRYNYLNIIL
jgi:hypothetical protein